MPISVDVYSRWDVVKEILTVAPAGFGDRFTLKQRTANVHAQLEPPGGEVVIYAAYADTGRWADSIGQKNLDAMRGTRLLSILLFLFSMSKSRLHYHSKIQKGRRVAVETCVG